MQAAFAARIAALPTPAVDDAGTRATLAFLQSDTLAAARQFEAFQDIAAGNSVLSFRLVDDDMLICQREQIAPHVVTADADEEPGSDGGNGGNANDAQGLCLVTGQTAPLERLHTAIKGVWGAQSSGANIVSFNLAAFNSFGKTQGANAPVSKDAAFAYTTALNALLANRAQRMQVGDASMVFWAQKPDPMEDWLTSIMGGDDPDAHVQQVKALFESVQQGGFAGARGALRFYVLGLAPNAARISIRFWHQAPLAEVATRIVDWFNDLRMVRKPNDHEYPSLFRLLTAVVVQAKADNIPPNLGGDIMRSILSGGAFPSTWLTAAVQRCRAEQDVTYLRAAAIKACLNRAHRLGASSTNTTTREITEMLDLDNPSPAYRLGRLFAVLERIQEEASPGLNATIRDRYYGAASSTPVAVFTTLLRLKNHHLGKIASRGRVVNLEKLIGEIMAGLGDFPVHLSMQEQGRFAIGYYHQRQDFFSKPEASAKSGD
jgi:CRISPR-associated protein Csd1